MITIKVDGLDRLRGELGRFANQLPFAAARALTETAKKIQASETAMLPKLLDRPTPFTLRTYAVKAARKDDLTAMVYARPIQAAYLAPEEFGLPQKVAKSAVLVPVDAALDAYGNLPRGAVRRYLGRPDVFVGTVKGIGGIWQRVVTRGGGGRQRAEFGRRKGQWQRVPIRAGEVRGLRLLVRFAAPVVPKVRLGFRERATKQAAELIGPELQRQVKAAIATARG